MISTVPCVVSVELPLFSIFLLFLLVMFVSIFLVCLVSKNSKVGKVKYSEWISLSKPQFLFSSYLTSEKVRSDKALGKVFKLVSKFSLFVNILKLHNHALT